MATSEGGLSSKPPSEAALELLSRVHQKEFDCGWKGTTNRDVGIADVQEIYLRMPPPAGRGKELPNRILSDYLRQLADAGHLKLSEKTDGERRWALSLSIKLMPVRSVARTIPPMPLWQSRLARAEKHWGLPGTSGRIRAVYEALNTWLHRGRPGMRLPLRERALQIFGQHPFFQQPGHPAEKIFDTLKAGPIFSDREEVLKLLNAFDVDPPLLSKDFSSSRLDEESGGHHRLGKGRGLLVVENSTTYWSISHMLGHIDHRIGHVAWGVGAIFQKSIGSIVAEDRISDVVYFGDLDASGLRIPVRADGYVSGLKVRPAVELYDALLRLGTPGRCPPKEARMTPARAQELAAWLDPRHRDRVRDLMLRGERLAQEWVGFDHLSTNEDWYTDVR
ncbi:Wadjet anti-phage system protein JetD domain-containing protein [Streptomyces sp. NPDC094032]|uniref:Wadjet anti-phage system protein JetD domain-containing protein n=1 Tax=Streptomyces sp. NPDC094032 TaxID=3155308 RepID=UPI003318542B